MDGFFTLLLGLQIIGFFSILKIENRYSNNEDSELEWKNDRPSNNCPTALIIPAYNEEKLILTTLSDIPKEIEKNMSLITEVRLKRGI